MIYESITALEEKLAERYDGPILEREGPGGKRFSYIPWTETVRRLNEVFGPFGWDTAVKEVLFANGVYTVAVELTVTARFTNKYGDDGKEFVDSECKNVVGVGSAVARGESDDNASKAALSDAISRAAKLLGDQFGFFLYEKGAPAGGNSYAPRQSSGSVPSVGGDLGRRPSEKQAAILNKAGIDYSTMPFEVWKKALDDHFANARGGF